MTERRVGGAGIRSALAAMPVPPAVYALGAAIAALAVLGAVDAAVVDLETFDLQNELVDGFNIPVLFSGGLLLAASVLAARLALAGEQTVGRVWLWALFALIFLEASIDEVATIHEELGESVDVDWVVLYLPLFALAGYLWLTVLRGLAGRPERLLWVGGAAAWVAAQGFELIAYGGTEEARPGTGVLGAFEELGEMTGTALFVWTLLLILQRRRSPSPSAVGSARPAASPD